MHSLPTIWSNIMYYPNQQFQFHVRTACILIQAWLWSTGEFAPINSLTFYENGILNIYWTHYFTCFFLWVFWGGKRVVQFFIHPHPSYSDINKWEPFEVDKVRWSTITGGTSSRSISKKTSGNAGWDSCAAWRLPRCHDFWWLHGW